MKVFCFLLLYLMPMSWAHENAEFHLAGMAFCVDYDSVQIRLDLPNQERAVDAHLALWRSLSAQLEESLTQAGVRANFVSSCAGSDSYTILGVEVRYLDPETYQGFAPQSYSYQVYLQVGRHNGVADLRELGGLPDNRYNDYVSEIYSEAEGGRPFEAFLTDPAQTLIWDLADYWWEDNPTGGRWTWLSPPLVGSTLALLTGTGLFLLLRRRPMSHKREPTQSG